MQTGYASSFKKEPVAQAIGKEHFSLLELVIRSDAKVSLREEVYIGQDKREKVQYIKGRLEFNNLTATARNELKDVVNDLVKKNEQRFVEFFNKTGAITIRQHSLELLPNIGKKHMISIIDEREKRPFESFKDITDRVKLMPDPHRVIVERILEELEGKSKYHLFVRGPKPVLA